MQMSWAVLALAGAVVVAGPARADDECWVPVADWQPREAVERMAGEQGWVVRRIKIDDGCYEVEGQDAQGRPVEVTVDPGTLAVLDVETEESGGDEGPESAPAGDAEGHED